LRSESKLNGESLNVLINHLLKSYVDNHKPAGKAGNIYFPKGALVQGRVYSIPNANKGKLPDILTCLGFHIGGYF
jgi:hypothetical protein